MKIAVITSNRAEYGLLAPLIREFKSRNFDIDIIVSGSHLSYEFGLTYKEIEFEIAKKVEILLSSDSKSAVCKAMGLANIGFSEAYESLKPDLIVVLGDRFEIFCAVSVAMIYNIKVIHLHGGELSELAYDDAFRHSITKMSYLHFVATQEYKNRVIQLGEEPFRVFNVGAIGIDNIKNIKLLSKEEFEQSINFKLNIKNLLITYHPTTLSEGENFEELLFVLKNLKDTNLIFTKANSDNGGREINDKIEQFVKENPNGILISSLGTLRYLSAILYVDGVIGNSSSGIIEVPSFKKGTINIGERQSGRARNTSIIDCKLERRDIKNSIEKLYSKEFQDSLVDMKSIFGDGGVAKKIVDIVSEFDFSLQKRFCDIKI